MPTSKQVGYKPAGMHIPLAILLSIALVLFCRLYSTSFFLPKFHFYNPSIFVSIVQSTFEQNALLSIIVITTTIAAGMALIYQLPWNKAASKEARLFVLFIATFVVFSNTTYEYNYIYDQTHTFDRIALIVILALSFWRPVFIALIPIASFCIQSQFASDIGAYSVAQISMSIKVLFTFTVCLLYCAITKRQHNITFAWMSAIVVMSHYWVPAYAKYIIDWHQHGQIHNMLAASYAGGWLNFISTEKMSAVLRFMAKFNFALMTATLVFETIAVIALAHRKLLLTILWIAVIFHIVVVIVSGIFIWHWLLVDAALICLIIQMRNNSNESLVSPKPHVFLLSCVLIATSHLWSGAPRLGWHDMPISYNYFIDVNDENGNTTRLTPAYFSPYEYTFTLGGFRFLSKDDLLPINWGSGRDLALAQSLSNASNYADINAIQEKRAMNWYDEERSIAFDQFIVTFLSTKQNVAKNTHWFDIIRSPLSLYTGKQDRNPISTSIHSINVNLKTTWFDGIKLVVVEDRILRSISP